LGLDEEHASQETILQELCDAGQDWSAVAGLLPQHWRAKAREFGAVRRQLRGFASIDALLRARIAAMPRVQPAAELARLLVRLAHHRHALARTTAQAELSTATRKTKGNHAGSLG